MPTPDLIAILGPTASGKTPFAAALAHRLATEVVSADSRQVYRRMDLGTGKDLADYRVDGCEVRHHLIDIAEPGEHYNIHRFQHDFLDVYADMTRRGLLPVVCGGSGLYMEAVLRGYRLPTAPENPELRARLRDKSLPELTAMLKQYKTLHNTTDVDTAQRAVRAIEIEEYRLTAAAGEEAFPQLNSLVVGLDISRDLRRERISRRLRQRMEQGMDAEVRRLLGEGLTPEQLMYYGLEYKYITLYVMGELSLDDMTAQLETAIHQFAKRQMTWFRGMERRGVRIHWIDATWPTAQKIEAVLNMMKQP